MVYPPDEPETRDSRIDVAAMNPGETALNPRTGKMFRVP
jgi:hypothetical protein